MIILKTETEGLLLSITKHCETLNEQTHRKEEETLKFKFTQPKQTFSFRPSFKFGADSNWMIGLLSLKV